LALLAGLSEGVRNPIYLTPVRAAAAPESSRTITTCAFILIALNARDGGGAARSEIVARFGYCCDSSLSLGSVHTIRPDVLIPWCSTTSKPLPFFCGQTVPTSWQKPLPPLSFGWLAT
jgi:hypothetical protein